MQDNEENIQYGDSQVSPVMVEPLMDVKGVARYVGRSTRWVWYRIKRGAIPVFSRHCGGKHAGPRFSKTEIDAWVRLDCPTEQEFRAMQQGGTA
jgi:predicted DNA-binding transcriptional regulator AlpA